MSHLVLFDAFAENYDAELNQALRWSGENKEFYAKHRVRWLLRCLEQIRFKVSSLLDFGCGVGDTTDALQRTFHSPCALGVDVSEASLAIARERHGTLACRFQSFRQTEALAGFDLAYCNGVFHHIPPAERIDCLKYIYDCLRPEGIFAFWENNPWNPGTRYVMSKIAFDRDAVPLPAPQARRLLRQCGFEVLRSDFCFFFPARLHGLRALEPVMSKLPFGAQYQILCRKPG
jgi:SAM-dependent methyltransferase